VLELLFGKYRNIIISIALFLLLDASVLSLNFFISFQISRDALDVNLSGRQRMLSQRMVKSLLEIQNNEGNAANTEKSFNELTKTVDIFGRTLDAFERSGETVGANGDTVFLRSVNTKVAKSAVEEAQRIWRPLQSQLQEYIDAHESSRTNELLIPAIAYARANNLRLLTLMNDLTVELESVASSKAKRLRWIQTVGISLAVLNFFIILFHFLRQLKESDKKIEQARGETLEILETVDEGLFLVDREFLIASQYSSSLKKMFARDDIAGLSFEQLLSEVIREKNMQVAKRFISLLYRKEIKENLILDLNPLKETEVHIADSEGNLETKYFSFRFERAYRGDEIRHILITVVDITRVKHLQKELEQTKAQNEQQIEALTSMLNANPDYLNGFVSALEKSVASINYTLKENTKSEAALRKKLEYIYIEAHRIKGEASALELSKIVSEAHAIEEQVSILRNLNQLSGDDFIPLVVKFEALVRQGELVKNLLAKMQSFTVPLNQDEPQRGRWQHLYELTESVARRNDKEVQLVMSGLDEHSFPEAVRKSIDDILIQAIRNAVSHGLEKPSDRVSLSKPVSGRIDVRLAKADEKSFELEIKDDGYGIDFDAIRKRALAIGRITEQQAEVWDSRRLLSLTFETGFSTADDHGEDAGAGAGMPLLKSRVMGLRGKIKVHSRTGAGTQLSIVFPVQGQSDSEAA
jgi:two-component system chemotaxis sensor kinase CheA